MKALILCTALGILGLSAAFVASATFAADKPDPASRPATRPTTSPAAQALLEQVRQAYAGAKNLAIDVHVQTYWESDEGNSGGDKDDYTCAYAAPNRFRAMTKQSDGAAWIFGSTGEKLYYPFPYYQPKRVEHYFYGDLPRKIELRDLDRMISSRLRNGYLAMALALTSDAAAVLTDGAEEVEMAPPTTIDKVACPTLSVTVGSHGKLVAQGRYLYSFDPATHLLRREVEDQNREDIGATAHVSFESWQCTWTFTIKTDVQFGKNDFDFTPPPGSTGVSDPPKP